MAMKAAAGLAEYLVTLQPPDGSSLAEQLHSCRSVCKAVHGVDEALLYPPHVSVTGFFTATEEQAAGVCEVLGKLLSLAAPGSLVVEILRALVTDDGHVLLDVRAAGIANLAERLSAEMKPKGVNVRPKDVKHMTLAKGRSQLERERIVELFRDVMVGPCDCDLVVARLRSRSDVRRMCSCGEAHGFDELMRLRLQSFPVGMADDATPRPLRKRPLIIDTSEVAACQEEGSSTPPKGDRAEPRTCMPPSPKIARKASSPECSASFMGNGTQHRAQRDVLPQDAAHASFAGVLAHGPADLGGLLAEFLWGIAARQEELSNGVVVVRRSALPELGNLLATTRSIGVQVVAGCKERRMLHGRQPCGDACASFHRMIDFLRRCRVLWRASRALRLCPTCEADQAEASEIFARHVNTK
eukprot:gnl/TRDRNA2_/TRDRNA2_176658_c0_seq3.p1 gnl/TRDRNA2_/TRDRNA2_176658_c0~~gnl/TRDRNA2_/TRDRNA2_176658_c0_seq3.p1  ORF type:complete len:434 (+),score=67.13 gnl/TRDRNA2_/TRDRNA2_176658_c0_seq3:66-1304(+)